MTDESYIQLAIEIAKKGKGSVSPNPLVGCIIVKDERIIGAGYHEKYGRNHAEINAINSSRESVADSTLFINLEPCSHEGLTPPCVDKIIEKKIKRVVIGTKDMNPRVSGNGIKKLKSAGIDVKVGILENECIQLNKFFFKYITKKIPYVTLKAAQTLDGKIADSSGDSKWISSISSRRYVHELRSKYDAVMIGYKTAIKDRPSLTVRLTEGRNPKRIILDTKLKLSTGHKIFSNNSDKNLIIITSQKSAAKKRKVKMINSKGAEIIFVREEKGLINLKSALKELAKRKIASVLIEGGSELFTNMIKKNLFDEILFFITPKILGNGLPVVENLGINKISQAMKAKFNNVERIGDDVLVELVK
ncbi:MAG TPA: bifunctional diaminohydroxyphosphoribosylaminopyrimidine deaminase/5-amino-6-(5-phosphoribosylamino)uracil reductase RibD [Ignavibacteriaceae bacterium]|nr:bifunctional diaminohydroxyphosphoribosylaminopyrimidine deaminase/5-amino-6-(5-phosphoribosylamino)uracil reductase RibD [Ignavibacteriaceae bacterium]